jgi:hypothetical protein
MDTPSHASRADRASRVFAVALAGLLLCAGCKSQPTNPFLARHEEPPPDENVAKTGKELAAEVEAAMSGTAKLAHDAAVQTAADATARGQAVAKAAADSAENLATQASATVQVQAIDGLATWPIEQAGPVLLLALAEGPPLSRRAAAKQLAERWPPARQFAADAAQSERQAMLVALRAEWVQQYGEINDAVVRAKAGAQEVLDDAQQVVDDANQVAAEARQVAVNAGAAAQQIQDMVVSLKQSDLPQATRREGTAMLERLAMDASAGTRARAARAMGEVADPAFLPELMGMLADQVEVQREALASLALVVGSDVTADRQNPPGTTDERVHRWQLWYQEHPGYRNPRARQ